MEKYNTLIEKLETKTPFALGRFNDGEMLGIWQAGQVVATKWLVWSYGIN